jgi:MFS family permease
VQPLRAGLATLRAALATPELRRLQASWAATSLGSWTVFVVLAIYAFGEGGAAAVGVAVLVRMLPAGLSAPFTSLLTDRRSRRDTLSEAVLVQAVALVLIVTAVALDAPLALVLALAAVQMIAWSAGNPAQSALLALLARSPEQLAAANVATYGIESAGSCVGSAMGGVLVASLGVDAGFVAATAAFVLAVVALRGLPRDAPPPHREARAGERLSREVQAGFAAVLAEPPLRLVVAALAVATLIQGAIDVLIVVVALDALDAGEAGLGWLNAAWGVGGIAGGAAAVALLGGGRLAYGIGMGCVLVALRSPASPRGRRSPLRSRCWSWSAGATR